MKAFKIALQVSRKMVLMVLPTLVGTTPWTLSAGINEWTSVGPEGGPIQALSIDPYNPATIYAATNYGGAFKSVDRGMSWVKSSAPNRFLIFDPQDANTIYGIDSTKFSVTCDGISKSTDGGTSWNPANSGLPTVGAFCFQVFALAIDPHDSFTLYAGTQYGIYKSTNGGVSWSSANSGLPTSGRYPGTFALTIDLQNPRTVFAVVDHFDAPGDLLYKSTDAGGSWNPASSGLPESSIILAIDPQNPNTLYAGTGKGVFKSTDGGANWSPVNSGLPAFPTKPYVVADSVVIDPLKPATVYATIGNLSGGKVFKTANGGASWSDASSGLPDGTYVRFLTIDPQIPATLYAETGRGVFKSTDGGISWSAANSGITATWIWDLAIDPQSPSTLYAVTSGGLLKTTDGGTTWSAANSGLTGGGSPLAINPQNTSTVFVGAGAVTGSGVNRGVFKSSDGGASWSASWIAGDSYSNWLTALAVDPQNSNIVYATTQGFDECDQETLHKSVDGGMSWSGSQFKDLGVAARCVLALVIDPLRPGRLYAAFEYGGGVFKSTDGGASWSAANSGLVPVFGGSFSAVALEIDPRNSSTLYAVSPRGSSWGVFKSNDGGASWNPASSGLPDWPSGGDCCYRPRLAVDPQNSDRVYLGAAVDGVHRVFMSADGGAGWTDSGLAVSGPGWWFGGLVVSSQDSSTVYAGTPGQGVFAMTNKITRGVQ